MTRLINVEYSPAPIPTDRFDYCATFDGYEPGEVQGYGRTKAEAIADLLDNAADEAGDELTGPDGQFGMGA